jgi:hypothetical protein
MQIIQHQELASAQASITFSSIPQTYTDLYLVVSPRAVASSDFPAVGIRFNSATTNYSTRYLLGSGSSAASGSVAGNYLRVGNTSGSSQTSNTFGSFVIYIPNYTAATSKSVSSDSVSENNATAGYQNIVAGLWSDNAAISTITVLVDGFNMEAYSSATLYGILKGSDGIVTVS